LIRLRGAGVLVFSSIDDAAIQGGEIMDKPEHDLAGWLGIVILFVVILAFLAMAKCQPDFFRDISLIQ
jgi:hypothetical protein